VILHILSTSIFFKHLSFGGSFYPGYLPSH